MTTAPSTHRFLESRLQRFYLVWRARRQARGESRRHFRRVDLLATCLPRLAAPFFPDILVRAKHHTPARASDHGDPRRTLYLTFDDGPTPDGTPKLIELLDRFQIPATFFLVGQNADQHPDLVRALAAAGHTIANHTWTHLDPWAVRFTELSQELTRTSVLLTELTGRPTRWLRPPHGHFTSKMRAWCAERKHRLALWDILPADFTPWATPGTIAHFVASRVRPGSVVCLHDSPAANRVTPGALEILLPRLLARHHRFAAL